MRARSSIATLATLFAVGLGAEDALAQDWLGFRGTLGYEWLGGGLGSILEGGVRTEWSVLYFPRPAWTSRPRVGVGISRVTYGLRAGSVGAIDTNGNSRHWHHFRWHLLLGIERSLLGPFDAYAELRQVWGRLRSQTEVLWPVPADDPPHDTPYREFDDRSTELVGGIQFRAGSFPVEMDVLARWGAISPRGASTFPLTDYGLPVLTDGKAWGIQIGVSWNP